MGWLLALGLIILALLWIVTWLRRRAIRTLLFTVGAQTTGQSFVLKHGKRTPRIAVSYTDISGVERCAVKSLVSAGDSELLKKKAVVLYHPKRASRADYVLLGFGSTPERWFPVDFCPRA